MEQETKTTWTLFWDMNSGGGRKEKQQYIYIEAPEEEAKVIFYNRFGHNPNRVSCTCCGEDYSISTNQSIEQLTGFHRNCLWRNKRYVEVSSGDGLDLISLVEYMKSEDCLFIHAKDIKPEERVGELPEQGYVWVD